MMNMHDDVLPETLPGGRLAKLEKLDLSVAKKLKDIYPNLPKDYLSFLEEVGHGEIGSAAYVIYNGLLSPNEIYDETTAEDLKNIFIFGDDMQGYCNGFDIENNWSVVEIDPTNMSYRNVFKTFSDFIREKLKEI